MTYIVPCFKRGWPRDGFSEIPQSGTLFASQGCHVFHGQACHEGLLAVYEVIADLAFALLEDGNLMFDSTGGDRLVDGDGAGLVDAVVAVDSLGLDGGIPPWVVKDDGVGRCQVEADAAGFEADQEYRYCAGLEAIYDG